MSSIGSPSPFFLAGKKAYAVERSLRFDDDQSSPTRLTRTVQSGGNLKKFTVSFWIKRSQLGASSYSNSSGNSGQEIIHTVGAGNRGEIKFTSADKIQFTQGSDAGGSAGNISTNAVFRDVNAWYHICVVADYANSTTADRAKIFVNGVRQEVSTATNFLDANGKLNTNQIHELGFAEYSQGYTGSSWWYNFFCGYMAEFYFIDGQAYDPSYFTETNITTGQLVPKEYTGSFGTTGWYLNFLDNSGTTATTLGKDSSGNSNNWTPNGFSVSTGAGNDSLEDSPTNNFATLNALKKPTNGAINNGNLDGSGNASAWVSFFSTILVSSGKWFCEVKVNATRVGVGIAKDGADENSYLGSAADTYAYFDLNGKWNNNSSSSYGATYTTNDIIGMALDMDAGTLIFYKNGVSQGTAFTGLSGEFALGFTVYGGSANASINYGQRAFDYTVPTGYKALNSANLPDPTINFPDKHFDTVLYTGDGNATGSQTDVLEFQPDWLWTKPRNAAYVHLLYDAVRGAGNSKSLNLAGGYTGTGAEGSAADNTTYGFLNSFDANGFSYTKGSATTTFFNQSSINYVVWNWNAGNTDGKTYTVKVHDFSGNNRYIFDNFQTQAVTLDLAEGGTYTFDQSDSSMSSHPMQLSTTVNGTHGGGSAYSTGVTYELDGSTVTASAFISGFSSASSRKLIITVAASAPNLNYYCYYHSGMGGAVNTNSTLGSSNFDGTLQATVKANATAGFSIITWTGNQTSGATLGHGLGVAPKAAFVKRRDGSSNWISPLFDLQTAGKLNATDTFTSSYYNVFFTSQPSSTVLTIGSNDDINRNTSTYVAYVFSEVAGYSKFGSYTGNGSTDGTFVFTGFRPAVIILKRTNSAASWVIHDNKRAGYNGDNDYLHPDLAQAESDGSTGTLDILSNGFKLRMTAGTHNGSGDTFIYLAFAESPFKYARAR